MNKINLEAPAASFAGAQFTCSCGSLHSFPLEKIVVADPEGAARAASSFLSEKKFKKILIVADENTISSGRFIEEFDREKIPCTLQLFPAIPVLVPDERALGSILMSLDSNIDCIVALGSGTINDLSRYAASVTNLPYVICPSAASMDGYTSSVSPLIRNKKKITYPAITPLAVFIDSHAIDSAPVRLVRAGFGDIIGKFTALADWQLAHLETDEYYCEDIAALMRKSLDNCVALARGDVPDAGAVMESLLLSGVAMSLAGNSRPASGAEHHIAHFWEMDALVNEKEHALHGEMVGVATAAVARLYEIVNAAAEYPALHLPPSKTIRSTLQKAGAFYTPQQIGIDRALFVRTIHNAMYVRDRYTVLRYAESRQNLHNAAEVLAGEIYG